MKITKKFIKENPEMKLKELCPELFENKLEVGKWYKSLEHPEQLIFILDFKDVQKIKAYGFDIYGIWKSDEGRFSWGLPEDGKYKPATPEEIKTALEKEAVKRGYKEGVRIKSFNKKYGICMIAKNDGTIFENNELWIGGCRVFSEGTWATIIKPNRMTKQEAKEKFNIEIV